MDFDGIETHVDVIGDQGRLLKHGLWLEYATLGWNLVGAVLMLAASRAGSVALAGFALDSLIEIFASMIVVWQLKSVGQKRERVALRLISAAFFLLATYILAQSIWTLVRHSHLAGSQMGLVWLGVTCVVMLILARGKLLTGRALDNPVLRAEAQVTMIDAALAGAVFVGVGLNTVLGWWWADPVAGLVIVYYGFREAGQAWRHDNETSEATQ